MLLAICLDAKNSETNSSAATLPSAHKSRSRLANPFFLSFLCKYISLLLVYLLQIIIFLLFLSYFHLPFILSKIAWLSKCEIRSKIIQSSCFIFWAKLHLQILFMVFTLCCLLLLLSQEIYTKCTAEDIPLHSLVSSRDVSWPALCHQHLTAAKIWLTTQLSSLPTKCHFLSPSNVLCIGIFFYQCFSFPLNHFHWESVSSSTPL